MTLYSHTCTVSCASGFVASDMDQVYQMGLFPLACCSFALVRNSTTWRVSHTIATVLVSGIIAEQSVHGMAETYPYVWNDSTSLKIKDPLLRAHQSAVLPPSHQQVPVTIATVSLCRKDALPLAKRATRPSRVQQH